MPNNGHPLKGKGYTTFTPDHDEKHAVESFINKYGKEPEIVFRYNGGQLWVGPEEIDNADL